jgi:Mg/Co/Ni transporter MgtE
MRNESGDRAIRPSGEVTASGRMRQMALAELTLSRAVKHLAQQYGFGLANGLIHIPLRSEEFAAIRILAGLRDEFRRAL